MGYPWEKDKEANTNKPVPGPDTGPEQMEEQTQVQEADKPATVLNFLNEVNIRLDKAIGKANTLRHLLG